MQHWEYVTVLQYSGLGGSLKYLLPNGEEKKVGGPDYKDLNKLLNLLGMQGYELVSAATSSTNAGIFSRYWVLKRPVG